MRNLTLTFNPNGWFIISAACSRAWSLDHLAASVPPMVPVTSEDTRRSRFSGVTDSMPAKLNASAM